MTFDPLEGVLTDEAWPEFERPSEDGLQGQVRMAHRFAHTYANQLMHVHSLGWYHWDGRRWVEDQQGIAKRSVMELLKVSWSEALTDRQLQADIRRCQSAAGVSGVLDLAAALEPVAFTVADLDADPYQLNCANGTLDLRTGQLSPHDPADRITKATIGAYDPDATSGEWNDFLARVLPDESVRSFLQRLAGMGLLGVVTEHILAILTGTGRNGKGVFYGALGHALGDYATVAEPDLFMHREGGHPTGEMDLRGIRWAVVSESDKNRRLAEATVKRLTGGDLIRARRMRQDFVTFPPSHTAVLVTNYLPKVSGDDPALWRRMRVIPFDVVIPEAEQDVHLGERLQLAADAILSWAVAGYTDYKTRGRLDEPGPVQAATTAYQVESDPLGRFIDECCFVSKAAWVTVADIFQRWQQWRQTEGAEEISQRAFTQALGRRGIESARTMHARIYRGISLLADDSEGEA